MRAVTPLYICAGLFATAWFASVVVTFDEVSDASESGFADYLGALVLTSPLAIVAVVAAGAAAIVDAMLDVAHDASQGRADIAAATREATQDRHTGRSLD